VASFCDLPFLNGGCACRRQLQLLALTAADGALFLLVLSYFCSFLLQFYVQGLADLDGEKQEVEAELQVLAEAAAKDLGLVLDKTLK
jgi:hypothetical protein